MGIKINYIKLGITGVFWVPIYLDIMDRICYYSFQFSPLSLSDWKNRYADFSSGKWIIDSGSDWLLLLVMLLYVPILFGIWFLLYRIRWRKIFHKHYASVEKVSLSAPMPVKKTSGPTKLRVQNSAILSTPPAQHSGGVDAIPQQQTVPYLQQNVPQEPIPQQSPQQLSQPVYEDEAEVQQMLAETAGVPADFFPHVSLDGAYASFALSTEKRAAVVRIINRPDSTFAVDTEVPIQESDWFYETGVTSAPAKDIMAIAKNLSDNEPDSVALPVILLMGGTLLNIEETLNYFEKNDVLLLRLPSVDADEIPLFSDFLTEYFSQGEHEEPELGAQG